MTPVLRMRRAPDAHEALVLDETQQRAVDAPDRVLLVRGAPGTGRSTVAVETVVAAVEQGLPVQQCLLLAPTRTAAARLRDRVTSRLGGTTSGPLARSHQSLGFGILRQAAALRGDPPPRLLNGPEQDVVLKELLDGYAAGIAPAPPWPDDLREALGTRGLRDELRDLLMRAVEWNLEADDLRRLGIDHDRPEWVAAAHVLDDYDEVTALSRPGAYDPAWILGAAADLLDEDPEALERVRSQARLVVVDDAQELTFAATRLLRRVVGPQTRVRLLTDPDSVVQGFRGADPRNAEALAQDWGAGEPVVLGFSHRQPAGLREVAQRVGARIGAVGGAEHRAPAAGPGGQVEVALLRAVSQESAHVAALLRRAHLLDGVPWSQTAVVVRAQSRTAPLRRALVAAGVPVSSPATTVPLREEPAVRPLLTLLELALDGAAATAAGRDRPRVDVETAVDLLTSPFGRADAVHLRRLRRELRRHEVTEGGSRSSEELLGDVVLDLDALRVLGPEGEPARRLAQVVRAAELTLARPTASAEEVLWRMWTAAGVADDWEAAALAGGAAGERADRDLDAVVALFGAAAAYVDRLPGLGAREFLEHVRGQDVPGDSLVARAPDDEQVALLTPAAAAGREWRLVVVAGVQEGVWPDLRLRGSLLGSEQLVDVLRGRGTSLRAAQAAVRHDETRQLLVAVTRATQRLVVTAVRSEDEQPSPYLDVIDPLEDTGGDDLRPFTPARRPMSLPAVVADLRRRLVVGEPAERERAAADLARLVRDGVPGAAPESWWAMTDLSDDRPLRPDGEPVRVSPSKVEQFTTCGLSWLLTTRGGEGPSSPATGVGTLVHQVVAELADSEPERMGEVLDARWGLLGLGDTWVSRQQNERAHRMLRRVRGHLDQAAGAGWSAAGVEQELTVRHGRAVLSGSVDRLEEHPEHGLRVIDWKTGRTKPTRAEVDEHAQLAAYQVATVEGGFGEGRTNAGAALVQVGLPQDGSSDPQVQAAVEGPGSWAHELVATAGEGMGAATVLAIRNKRCPRCPVRACCPLQPEGKVLG